MKLIKSIFSVTALLILGIAFYGQFIPQSNPSTHNTIKATHTACSLLAEDIEDEEGLELDDFIPSRYNKLGLLQVVSFKTALHQDKVNPASPISSPIYLRIRKLSI